MDLHVDLDDDELDYLQSIGLTDNIEEALTEVGKAIKNTHVLLSLKYV